jgi:hypothetical protein
MRAPRGGAVAALGPAWAADGAASPATPLARPACAAGAAGPPAGLESVAAEQARSQRVRPAGSADR